MLSHPTVVMRAKEYRIPIQPQNPILRNYFLKYTTQITVNFFFYREKYTTLWTEASIVLITIRLYIRHMQLNQKSSVAPNSLGQNMEWPT